MGSRFGLVLSAAVLLGAAACVTDDKAGAGGLAVVLESDLSLPKDLDRVKLTVTQGSKELLTVDQPLGEMHLLLPAEFRVPPNTDPSPVTVHAIGYKSNEARIERSAVTQIPGSRTAMLRLSLNYLCVGTAAADGTSTCGQDQTCKQGACIPALVADTDLPAYEAGPWSSGGVSGPAANGGSCFDVLSCFAAAVLVPVDAASCTFTAPISAQIDHLNVAIKLPIGSEGICGAGACWVALDSSDDGFRVDGTQVELPASVCQPRPNGERLEIAVTSACGSKSSRTPPCGTWTVVTMPVESPVTDISPGTSGGAPMAAVGSACDGLSTMTCGMCGARARVCQGGVWGNFSTECIGEAKCTISATMPCGPTGTGIETCGSDCNWGQCLGEMCMGAATRSCGNCGTQRRHCADGVWSEWEACTGEGMCMPGTSQVCQPAGNQACGGACQWDTCTQQTCDGAASEPCGMCGTRTRTCTNGTWSAFSDCTEEGECMPNATRMCGATSSGTQTCGGNCKWDAACTGQTCAGATTQLCGNCGTQTRTCNMETGQFSDWGACNLQGECTPTMTQACGTGGTQTCADNCKWDPACTGQTCDGPSSEACGMCGTRTRTCNGTNGQWNDWSACNSQGVCSPGATENCPNGQVGGRTCSNSCQWTSTCMRECTPGQSESAMCGNCNAGRRTRTCSAGGMWGAYGTCSEGGCEPGAMRTCPNMQVGNQTCSPTCDWTGTCTPRVCTPNTAEGPTACGMCGTHNRTCNGDGSAWGPFTTCANEGVCKPAAMQACPNNPSQSQTCSNACQWQGPCTARVCSPGTMETPSACGNCGTRTRTCNADGSAWGPFTTCGNEGMCKPASMQACPNNPSQSQTCSNACQWQGPCTARVCEPGAMETPSACGNCGTHTRTCMADGSAWGPFTTCGNEGVCKPASMQACPNNPSQSQTCTNACQWQGTCTARVCEPGAMETPSSCGNCGTHTRTCNADGTAWSAFTTCANEGMCAPGTAQTCPNNPNQRQTCSNACEWQGTCTASECTPGANDSKVCGNCGTQGRTCSANGTWGPYGACDSEGECAAGTQSECLSPLVGTRTCSTRCAWDNSGCTAPMATECKPGAMDVPTACGNCGTHTRVCGSDGFWQALGACGGEGVCVPGATLSCPPDKLDLCTELCQWRDGGCPIIIGRQ